VPAPESATIDQVRQVIRQARHALVWVETTADAVSLVRRTTAAEKLVDAALKACRVLTEEQFELRQQAAEVHLRTQRRAGELLAEVVQHEGGRPRNATGVEGASRRRSTLRELGIDVHESHRWQRIASVPVEEFERGISDSYRQRRELTTTRMLTIASRLRRDRVGKGDLAGHERDDALPLRRYQRAKGMALRLVSLDPDDLAAAIDTGWRQREIDDIRRMRSWLESLERSLSAAADPGPRQSPEATGSGVPPATEGA
jgi:hypothetical protein